MLQVADAIISAEAGLSQADRDLGDGDHGPGMATISPGATLPLRLSFPATGVYRFNVTATGGTTARTEPLIV